jgi:hypothetical protein
VQAHIHFIFASALRFGNCDNDPSNGCEANFATDADNCGACGQAALFTNGIGQCRAGQPFLASCRPG